MIRFLAHWAVVAVALWLAAYLLPGVRVGSLEALAVGALVLGLVNAIVRPVLTWVTFPVTVLTLGLFLFVVNGLAFGLAAWITPGFAVTSLWQAILGAAIVSVVSWVADLGGRPRTRRRSKR
ncbi:MAG: phage holin family protein [Myxococcota bacterium]